MDFKIIDLQQNDVEPIYTSETGVRNFAYEIVTNRAYLVDENDDCGKEFIQWVKEGFEWFTWERAMDVLKDWEYQVTKI